jgi:aryl-alcohol dehydrogenase-like predicted oxidoreductase
LLTSWNDTPGARGRRAVGGLPEFDPDVRRNALAAVERVAAAHVVSMAQVALAWVLAQPGVTSAIVGARSIEQLDDNLAAADLVLEADEIAQLDAVTAPKTIYPATVDRQWGFAEPPYTPSAAHAAIAARDRGEATGV